LAQTGDHLGCKGLTTGGGVGLVVGLFAPPLLASAVVGGAAGGLIGKFARHKVETGPGEKPGCCAAAGDGRPDRDLRPGKG
jgi:arylsulfatase